jgi:hypothetical protein
MWRSPGRQVTRRAHRLRRRTDRPANLRDAPRVAAPRAYRALPSWALAGGRRPGVVDARLYDDVVWILRRYRLRVSAAREAGHRTHGDGTALDLLPAEGSTQATWDASAGALAHDLGWTPACAGSGTRPACHLAPAIQFVGYDGYPPRLAAHLHGLLPRPPPPLLGLAVLRHQRALTALPLGHGVRRPAGRRPDRRAARTVEPPGSPTPPPLRVRRVARCASLAPHWQVQVRARLLGLWCSAVRVARR